MHHFRYTYYLTKIEGLGSVRIKKLLEKFHNAENVFDTSVKEISSIEGFSSKTAESILKSKNNFDPGQYDKMLSKAESLGIEAVTLTDEGYPLQLKEIYDPPVILYYKGLNGNSAEALKKLQADSVGIVGTRTPSDYGKKMSENFAVELAMAGINVVSGFARGVDTHAHKAVISNNSHNAVTAAVFGCGVDVIYPPENKKLYAEMNEKGIMLSEYEIGAKPDAINFPKRNRIISGLARGVIVVESGKEGGALITARCALDQGREVFAVPGYISSKVSVGTNGLIKAGQAKLIQDVDDILVEIGTNGTNSAEPALQNNLFAVHDLNGNEKVIFDILHQGSEPVHIDAISESANLNISDCLVTLLNLEFKGIINQLPGKRFSVIN